MLGSSIVKFIFSNFLLKYNYLNLKMIGNWIKIDIFPFNSLKSISKLPHSRANFLIFTVQYARILTFYFIAAFYQILANEHPVQSIALNLGEILVYGTLGCS